MTDRNGAPLRAFPITGGRWRFAADLDHVDPAFVEALLAYEDKRFFDHAGVDPVAILRAVRDAIRAGRIVSGASTLTMQTARLLEPRPRTLGGKLLQMLRALQLELRLDKREILELYLTLAPYGGNLEGVRAASLAWFGREPRRLTIDEIALLVALPQSPESRRPDLHPETAATARSRVLERLAAAGLARADAASDAARDPVPARRPFPALAWHGAAEVARRSATRETRSTLDASLQRRLEALAARAFPEGDTDAQVSLLVVETATRAVRAHVGSATRDRPGGWLDLTNRQRSPGSTLKPFVYGLAFDDGLATGGTRIADLPRRFHDYRPGNFDGAFRGEVTVADALRHSLNVPAVLALDAIGAGRFDAALAFAGVRAAHAGGADADPGLALALGGIGMTARDLAVLYAALDDGGRARPLRWLEVEGKVAAEQTPGRPILGAESAEEILRILRSAPQPAGRMPAALTRGAPRIAFKTGTSYGFRDAWAAGVARGHVIVVWTGRADGTPRTGATGREVALPILFEAFDALPGRRPLTVAARAPRDAAHPPSAALREFGPEGAAPHILFPPDDAEVLADRRDRSFALAARGAGELRWFADGEALLADRLGGVAWTPSGPGFYELVVVDQAGRSNRARVRIVGPGG